ncbi:hypothetical protein B0H10DRAFT_1941084 [Mycena sp. CBHHK59/15]|nr:hypothetical protein B0H10DRAFT_1941084 [Mycena sp. CBHHK59/15]
MPKHYLNPFRKGVHRGGTPYSSAIRTPPSASRHREDEFRPFDPTPGQIQAFHEQYEAALAAGQIVTYSLEKKCLVEWFRPVTYNNQGIVLPVCPHLSNPFQLREECTMKCKKSQNHWVFCCPSHGCEFIMIVPPVASAKVLLTEQELTDYVNSEEYMDGNVTDSGDEGFSVKYNTSGSMDWSPQTTSSASSIGQVSSYLTHLSPSSSLDSISSMPTGSVNSSPTRPHPSPHKSDGRAVAYFSVLVAETRGSPNHTFVLNIYNNHEAGLYKTHPEKHPIHQSPLAAMLLPYHPAVSIRRIADCMQHMTTPTGLIIRQFTSTTGIPYITFLHLQKDNYPCLACICMYSLMGHQQHRHRSGRCTNNVDLPMIEEQDPPLDEVPFLKFRSYPADARIPHSISDKAHRNEGGECQDIGQGQTSSILKGKGH